MTSYLTSSKIPETERKAILNALVLYYSGHAKLADALKQTEGISKGTYYKRKADFPDEIKELHDEARAIALRERSDVQTAFDSEQLAASIEVQGAATEVLKKVVPELARIARGEPRTVYVEEKGQHKTLFPYARDQAEAVRILQSLAKGGVLPEGYVSPRAPDAESQSNMLSLPPVIAPRTFNVITVPEGARVQVGSEAKDEVVEG